jgi:ABC-2 type transport system ATP-binding protein
MSAIVECLDLTKNFGSNTALDHVNLSLEPGRIVGLLGPNGSGKTTLLKLMSGLLQPTTGQILIQGNPPSPESKAIVSFLPDKTYLSDWMKVSEIFTFFKTFYQDFDEGRAYEMLSSLDIDKKARFKTLSKGTKEKVQLILVMARKAKLYLLDEPIGGVDPAARDYILKTIIQNYDEEATLLISTHLIQDIEQVFDDIIFLNKGKVVLQGSVDDIRAERNMSIDALFREEFKC